MKRWNDTKHPNTLRENHKYATVSFTEHMLKMFPAPVMSWEKPLVVDRWSLDTIAQKERISFSRKQKIDITLR